MVVEVEVGTMRAGKQAQNKSSNESNSHKKDQSLRRYFRKTYSLWPRDDGLSCVGQFGVVISMLLQQSLNREMKHYLTTQNRQSHTFSKNRCVHFIEIFTNTLMQCVQEIYKFQHPVP